MTNICTRPLGLAAAFAALLCLAGSACVSEDADIGRAQESLAVMPSLGAAQTFALLAGSTVTSTGPSRIVGDVGVSPGTAIVGFPPATVTGGALHAADGPAGAAQNDLTTAYVNLAGQPCGTVLTGVDLGGRTLMPGVYCFSTSAQLTGTLTLDGMGDPNAVFVFQIGSTLTTASTSAVNMIGSAIPGRVFWQVGSSATLGTGTQFSGNILAMASITATTGSSIAGRALARTGAVTIDGMNGEAVPTVVIPPPPDAGMDAGMDASMDAGTQDAGTEDASMDAGTQDAGTEDAGTVDAGVDAGTDAGIDAGTDAGIDAGTDAGIDAGTDAGVDAGPARPTGGLSGGALGGCSAAPGASSGGVLAAFLMFGLIGAVATRRRRGLLPALFVVALILPGVARAQSLTLNQFRGSETPEDGLEISRPIDLGNVRFAANVYLDYARNPLVYETTAGNASTQSESIVRDQFAVHLGVAVGLLDRFVVFARGSGNFVMAGEERSGYVAADGTRMGDLTVGGRVRLLGTPRLGDSWYGALGLQLGMTLPTAHWISSSSQLSGDSTVTATPELLAEVGGRSLRLTANLGARLRSTQSFDTLSVGSELVWGIGLGVPLVGRTLEADLEAYGTTGFDEPFTYETSPVEAIAGLRWRAEQGWTAAIGAGPGLARGYGSPAFRVVATLGWTQPAPRVVRAPEPEPEPEPVAETPAPLDTDHDGVIDSLDNCPRVPGPADNQGCARFVRLMPTETAPAEIVILHRIEFETDQSGTLHPVTVDTLEEVRAVIEANPQLRRIAIEGHADERQTDEYNMTLSKERANAVMRWLVAHGVDPNRLEAHGYGEREPFAPGTSPEAQQLNRNVQFFIVEPPPSHPPR